MNDNNKDAEKTEVELINEWLAEYERVFGGENNDG